MKKIYKLFAISAVSAFAFISCTQEQVTDVPTIVNDEETGIQVTITTGEPVSKTMISGSSPYWCDGDAIGVSNGTSTNAKFDENSIDDAETALKATFSGKVGSEGTYYAYSPYTSNGVGANGAKVDIPLTQRPTATSFDGSADVMVSKSFDVSTTSNTTIENLQFARLGAIVKVVLIDNSPSYDLSSQHPTTLSLTAEANLVGRVYIDMVNQELGDLYSGGSVTVTAQYTALTQFAINGSNAAYFVVYPQTLAEGTHLVLNASTESYNISKDIILPAGGIELKSGKVTTLNISIADGNISPATVYSNVEAINWDYTFDSNPWGSTSGNKDLTSGGTTINWKLSANYATYNNEVLALNTGSNTNAATISTNNVVTNVDKVVVRAKTNKDKEVTLEVKVGDESLGSETLSSVTSLTDYTFTNATPLSGKISIEFTSPTGGYQIKGIKINPKQPVTLSFASSSLEYNTNNYGTCTGQTVTASPNVSAITGNISYALSGDAIGSVNASTGVVTLNGSVGSATITASFPGDATYGAAANSYTISVVSADANDGSLEHPYTVTEALAIIAGYSSGQKSAEQVYVSGIVAQVGTYNSTYHSVTYDISVDGTTSNMLNIYGGRNVGNTNFTSNSEIAVNDEVVIYGYLCLYSETKEMYQNNYISSLNGTKYLAAGSLDVSKNDALKQITVTWGAASGSNETITYTVSCGGQTLSPNPTTAGSHTFTMADYGTYTVTVVASASDASSATVSTSATLSGGTTYTITWNSTNNSAEVNDYTSTWSVTADELTLTMKNWNNNRNGWSYVRCGRKTNKGTEYPSVATIEGTIPEAIHTVKITIDAITASYVNSATLYVASDDSFTANLQSFEIPQSVDEHLLTITSPAENQYYKIEFDCASGTANGFVQLSKLVFTTD